MGGQQSSSTIQNDISNINFITSGSMKSDSNIESNQNNSQAINTLFTWNQGGQEVFLTGSFTNWEHHLQMSKIGQEFVKCLKLPRGIYYYKFIVDNQWTVSNQDQTKIDQSGNLNNYVDTTNYKLTYEAIKDDLTEIQENNDKFEKITQRKIKSIKPNSFKKLSRQSQYHNQPLSEFTEDPPMIPNHLKQPETFSVFDQLNLKQRQNNSIQWNFHYLQNETQIPIPSHTKSFMQSIINIR